MDNIYDFSLEELQNRLVSGGFPSFVAGQVFGWIYKKRVDSLFKMSNLSKESRAYLEKQFSFSQLKLIKKQVSKDGTEKFLFGLEDKNSIETVFIPERTRNTLCHVTHKAMHGTGVICARCKAPAPCRHGIYHTWSSTRFHRPTLQIRGR